MTSVTLIKNIFDEWLGDIEYSADSNTGKLYPFFVRVGCVKMAAPRHERFEYVLNIGVPDIDKVFSGNPFRKHDLTFVFPERFMSVHEQRGLMHTLTKHPNVKSIKTVDILTSSPILIGEFYKEQIRILTWADDQKHNGDLQFKRDED